VLGQGIIDFAMAQYGLFLSVRRIVVDVVASAVSQKDRALLFNLADHSRCASQRDFFGLVILRHLVQRHHAKSVFEIFLKLFERLALGHNFGMLEQLPELETFALPVNHRQFWAIRNLIGAESKG